MKVTLKITRPLLEKLLNDLERPHGFAYERLGYISVKVAQHAYGLNLLATAYHPVADGHYVPDENCGARMGGEAIRHAMERCHQTTTGQLWIHTHGRRRSTEPSRTDRHYGPRVATSLANAGVGIPCGWAVISEYSISGEVILPKGEILELGSMSVVGRPMRLSSDPEITLPQNWEDRFSRQSFLGKGSADTFARARIGIIGLGGGGSHINQQLACLGFSRFVHCDDDFVSLSNLNRLVGATLADAKTKQPKTTVAERVVQSLHPKADLDSSPQKWEDKLDQLKGCDLIFSCVDTFSGRRDIEAFCRRYLIPLIDIGMTVKNHKGHRFEIYGQVQLSMPGASCLYCTGFLTEELLALEAQKYGDAGPQPQVVWPNAILASTAVGIAVELLTGWSKTGPYIKLDYRGSTMTLAKANACLALENSPCTHYPIQAIGDVYF
jgi:hypothetical protein